jgi:hypothetical protein
MERDPERRDIVIRVRHVIEHVSATDGLKIEMSTPLWTDWFAICREQTARARQHASAGTDEITLERRASLVAVAAAAHAIEGIYGAALAEGVAPVEATPRRARVFETLKHAFNIGPRQHAWAPEFEWLWRVRDFAVHHDPELREPVPHPEQPTNISVDSRDYSAHSAERALDLLEDVVKTCIASPTAETADWAERAHNALITLELT